ncbi:MAG: hypothetical protein Q7K26_06720 [bacterium]|nr:hypothetical protein [bacterium]
MLKKFIGLINGMFRKPSKEISNLRSVLTFDCGNYDHTAPELREIVGLMHDALPDGDKFTLTKEECAIVEAGTYVMYHRLDQAVSILEELSNSSRYSNLAQTVIKKIVDASKLSQTTTQAYALNKRNHQIENKNELDILSASVNNSRLKNR